jgi:hypothetical protein
VVCERCEALDIQCTHSTDRDKRQRPPLENGARKHAKQMKRPASAMSQVDAMWLSKPNICGVSKPLATIDGTERTFIEQWPAFTLEMEHWLACSAPSTEQFASPSTSQPNDVVFWAMDSGAENSTALASRANNSSTKSTSSAQSVLAPERVSEPLVQGREHTQEAEQAVCRCMNHVVFLLVEVETRLDNDEEEWLLHEVNNLDSALGLHREAVRYGESMRQCRQCSSRAEMRLLLLLLANRLVALCALMVSSFCNVSQARDGPEALPSDLSIAIMVGEYEVDSAVEGGTVLRELIAFQLRSLCCFIASLASTHGPQGAKFVAAKNKVIALIRHLQENDIMSD